MSLSPLVFLAALTLILSSFGPAVAGMSQSYQATGNLGLDVTGAAAGNFQIVSGTLTVNKPLFATTQKAFFYVSQINNPNGLSVMFQNVAAPMIGPPATDPQFNTLYNYAFDVTSWVTPGVQSYSYSLGVPSAGSGIAGVALVVVWQDPSEPLRTVTIIDGMQQVGEAGPETESVTFSNLPSGSTSLFLFTVYDDSGASGETISYNGSSIGGPIDGFLGLNASVVNLSATSVSGSNTLSIATINDHMGWMVAGAAVLVPPVSVQAATWGRTKASYR
ncbi:MAG: DUF3344 domain-containing protein [Candidatus Eiseniibacteriota bacterium]